MNKTLTDCKNCKILKKNYWKIFFLNEVEFYRLGYTFSKESTELSDFDSEFEVSIFTYSINLDLINIMFGSYKL